MTTMNELREAVHAARERCLLCRYAYLISDPKFGLGCCHPRKWSSEMIDFEEVPVYPGDLYYFYDHYIHNDDKVAALASERTAAAHALVGPVPCPLYEKGGPRE